MIGKNFVKAVMVHWVVSITISKLLVVANGSHWQPMPTSPLLVILYTGYCHTIFLLMI